jgi:hypothetical protein
MDPSLPGCWEICVLVVVLLGRLFEPGLGLVLSQVDVHAQRGVLPAVQATDYYYVEQLLLLQLLLLQLLLLLLLLLVLLCHRNWSYLGSK